MGTNSKTSHQSYTVAPTAASSSAAASSADTADLEPTSDPNVITLTPELTAESTAELTDSAAPGGAIDTTDSGATGAPTESAPDQESGQDTPDEAALTPASEQPLTPIPATPQPGLACGHGILVGGEDLDYSTATLVSYLDTDGPRTVLHAVVSEDAEEKLLDALHLSDTTMIPVHSEQTVTKRLPIDEQHEVLEKLVAAAKSINHHITNGTLTADTIPDTTSQRIATAHQAVAAMSAALGNDTLSNDALSNGSLSDEDTQLLAHYTAHLDSIDAAAKSATKTEHIDAFLRPTVETVTTYVPAPATKPPEGKLPAVLRDATRIKPTIDNTGHASWDGVARHDGANGKEYVIDMGDGYTAVYRPYAANDPKKTEYSLRGRLEMIAPAGDGQGPDLVHRLGHLNLANRAMTREEGEWTYLNANVIAQSIGSHPAVAQAVTAGSHLEEMVRQELFHERAHHAVGLDAPALARFAKDLQLEAATRALPAKVGVLRDAVAKATGHGDGAALAATPGYDPTPRHSGGWLTWNRFDVGNALPKLRDAMHGKALTHSFNGSALKQMVRTGVLASTERRVLMGVKSGIGKSETDDKHSGGASSVFLRVGPTPTNPSAASLVWDDPARLLARADYYGSASDTFGAINPQYSTYSNTKLSRNPFTIAQFTNSSNEVMFRDGIDLLGAEAPSRIICASTAERNDIRAMLTAKGITTLGGKPVNDVVI